LPGSIKVRSLVGPVVGAAILSINNRSSFRSPRPSHAGHSTGVGGVHDRHGAGRRGGGTLALRALLVERQISTPDRQIRLGGIEGALSSDVRISSITVSDREGEWLRIEDVHLVWSRTSLLRRRLEIELLEAGSITVARPPLPAEGPSEPFEERTIELPEFPVTLNIETVRVPRVGRTSLLSYCSASCSSAGSTPLAIM
jgi:hypothetical protein